MNSSHQNPSIGSGTRFQRPLCVPGRTQSALRESQNYARFGGKVVRQTCSVCQHVHPLQQHAMSMTCGIRGERHPKRLLGLDRAPPGGGSGGRPGSTPQFWASSLIPCETTSQAHRKALHSQAGRGCGPSRTKKAEKGLTRDRCVAPAR